MSEDTYEFECYKLPIPIRSLRDIEQQLRTHEVFCTSDDHFDCYSVEPYLRAQAHHKTKIFALLDRNALIDVLSLTQPVKEGLIKKCAERCRIGAAMMAFFQCSHILVDPCMALYENPVMAADELKLFRQADNLSTDLYAKIALGVIDYLPPDSLPALRAPPPVVNYNKPITGSKLFRIALLKIAELDVSNLSPMEKMEFFIQWSYEKLCFLSAPSLLAAIHFTPHRKSSPLKNIRIKDRKMALKNIQNAVWDIHVIHEWGRRVTRHQDENHVWLLCSRDAALKRIARTLLAGC